MRVLLFLFALMIVGAGCRNRAEAPEKLRVSMDINIQEAAPPPVQEEKVTQKKTPVRRKSNVKAEKQKTPEKKSKTNKSGLFQPVVPPATGAFDSELNSVERSYVNDIRRRREKSVRDSEAKVFGSYSPGALFKQPSQGGAK
jgi:hypothetical protein